MMDIIYMAKKDWEDIVCWRDNLSKEIRDPCDFAKEDKLVFDAMDKAVAEIEKQEQDRLDKEFAEFLDQVSKDLDNKAMFGLHQQYKKEIEAEQDKLLANIDKAIIDSIGESDQEFLSVLDNICEATNKYTK